MNLYISGGFFFLILVLSVNFASAQVDPLVDIKFLQTGILNTNENEFHISNELTFREFANGKIIRVSGQTIEGFPYITYSKIFKDKIDTHGIIFIKGQFTKLKFDEEPIVEESIVEKKEDVSLLVKYSQRVYSEKIVYIDVKIYDKKQNKLNNFDQNYGYVSNVDINVQITDESEQVVFSSNGITNKRGLFETQYLIPENSKRETLTVTITAENENSTTSKILQVFSLGQIPSDGKSS